MIDIVGLEICAEKLKKYCKEQENCKNCFFAKPIEFPNIGEIGYFCKIQEKPFDWEVAG